ncbi:MAG TPA: SRPBCC family protein [Thermoanaerobaculia bacterium]|nr:SRPBCC family protein [Thermoanaerobaculia bacterium]
MQTLLEARNVSVSIQRSPQDVYDFASNLENLPRWATGLGGTIRKVGGDWIAEGPMGMVKIRFAEPNELGVLDHDVVLPSGGTIHNPMRVVPNGTGSEVTFTVFRHLDVPDEQFEQDAEWVEKDLRALKAILEG